MNKLFLNNLPASPGVYKMLDDNKDIIYVGKAGNLKKRVSSYITKSNQSLKNQRLINKIKDIVKNHKCLFLLDAVHFAPHFSIDVKIICISNNLIKIFLGFLACLA